MQTYDPWQPLDYLLYGKEVVLEPLENKHYNDLEAAANDPAIWTLAPLSHNFKRWFQIASEEKQQKKRWPFVVRQINNNCIVGSISYYEMDIRHRRGAIGRAWYHPDVWETKIFPDCMLTLLKCGFEVLGLNRIAWRTNKFNKQSQRAIEKIGGTYEGTLREHFTPEGGLPRDVMYYSILLREWTKVKENLEKRLSKPQEDTPELNQPFSDCG